MERLEILFLVPLAAAIAAAIGNLWKGFFGLRAKRAAQAVVAKRALGGNSAIEKDLQSYALLLRERKLNDEDIERVSKLLGEYLAKQGSLTDKEMRRVAQGLKQPNKGGERRYVEELMGA